MRQLARFLAASMPLFMMGAHHALAGPNLVSNGSFSTETVGGAASTTSAQLSGYSGYTTGATLTGWTNSSYDFVFTPGVGVSGTTADTTGATINQYGGYNGNPNVYIYGPGLGGGLDANGLTNSPDGGNFVAVDGYYGGSLSQVISGLVVGWTYTLSFYSAGAEQYGFTGTNTDNFTVTFGSSSYTTATNTIGTGGFSPWKLNAVNFVASATSQTLSFLAAGGPNGTPPLSLLDGVSLTVPEPSSWAAMMAGLGCLGLYRRRTRRAVVGATGIEPVTLRV